MNPGPPPPEPAAGPGRLQGPGDLEPIPGQLALPGMPSAAGADGGAGGQLTLPGLDSLAADARDPDDRETDADAELAAVAAELRGLDGDGSRMAAAIRGALDMLLDGQHTGRYRWDQLHKTEKTHAGTLVEIALARTLRLADGAALDYTIAGADVDCKFSHRLGGWMIPPEADGKLMLLVQASDEDGTWSAGLLRAAEANLRPAGNRDGKRALSERGRAAVCWLHARAPLQENVLIRLPGRDVAAIFAAGSGQQRVNELFRRCRGAQGPGLCPVHPAGGRRLAARLGRRSGRARPRAPPLRHRLRRPVEPQVRPIWTRRKCLRSRPGT